MLEYQIVCEGIKVFMPYFLQQWISYHCNSGRIMHLPERDLLLREEKRIILCLSTAKSTLQALVVICN